jgi:hypothetical protein
LAETEKRHAWFQSLFTAADRRTLSRIAICLPNGSTSTIFIKLIPFSFSRRRFDSNRISAEGLSQTFSFFLTRYISLRRRDSIDQTQNSMPQSTISLDTLSQYFHLPITEVARKLGVRERNFFPLRFCDAQRGLLHVLRWFPCIMRLNLSIRV